ncbi:glycosyltransferase family 4 protein [Porticoccus sp. W117]|uniref:glycosyltransferase family 4 protein n=1 Tax=Porticoccus sp. W117 TaxID=3054777 RepID=UPI002598C225|nr:glycosyltransferase family 4 protein [Porticoccus sp. W117]MDM3870611.1 glycosyltransferase family 4 protein [Porticoccus sp. W117]
MRLAYFTNSYPRATDTFIRREVVGLRERGFSVSTFSVHKVGLAHDVDEEVVKEKSNTHYLFPTNYLFLLLKNIKLLVCSPVRYLSTILLGLKTARPGAKGFLLQVFYFQEAVLLACELRKGGIEHLHNHLGDNSGTVTLLASKMTGIPYSISIHGPHIFFDALHWALAEKLANSEFVSCIGHFCKSQMMLYTQEDSWNKLKIVRCGIRPAEFPFLPPETSAKKMLYVGRLSSEKGLPILFESMVSLLKSGRDFELHILGDGEERAGLETLAIELGLSERVIFHGFANRSQVREWLSMADIFVLPSFAEGIPVALMEAMACGTPVIATYVGGVIELVRDRETGLVVSPSDVSGLSEAIASYLDDDELCLHVASNARRVVCEKFDIDKQVDKLAALFKKYE